MSELFPVKCSCGHSERQHILGICIMCNCKDGPGWKKPVPAPAEPRKHEVGCGLDLDHRGDCYAVSPAEPVGVSTAGMTAREFHRTESGISIPLYATLDELGEPCQPSTKTIMDKVYEFAEAFAAHVLAEKGKR